jgi:Holliday junction resolvase
MTAVSRGHGRERSLVKLLREQGCFALRAPASLGVADVVALKLGETPRLYECKSTLTPYAHFQPADRQELIEAAERAGAEAILAWWPKGGKLKLIPSALWPQNC